MSVLRLIVVVTAITAIQPATGQEAAAGSAVPLLSPVTWERLVNAADEPHNWLMYSGTLSSQRFSRLDQITNENVAQLELVWAHHIPTLDRAELATYAEQIVRILSDPGERTDALSLQGKAMLVRDATMERDRLNDRRAPGDDEVAATLDRLANAVTASASQPLPALPPRPTVH